ncbi:MAG: ABC transporter permease [Phycisphaerae bacterium]
MHGLLVHLGQKIAGAAIALGTVYHPPTQHHYVSIFADIVIVLLILAFILTAFRDIARLGRGLSRAWAIGRVTVSEAWNARMWAVPLVWFAVCALLGVLIVRGYEPAGVVRVYMTIFLRAQVLVLLIYLGIMACITLPRERERHTLVTTGSKPISRLELLLGKVLGLSAAGVMILAVMMILTWGYMKVVDLKIRHDAAVLYALQKNDYDKVLRRMPPDTGVHYLAQHGVLQAQNYVSGHMSIAGYINYQTNPPSRLLKGGSSETLYFEFPSLPATGYYRPMFDFQFAVVHALPSTKPVTIQVTMVQRSNPMNTQHTTLTLNSIGQAAWMPQNPTAFFSYVNPQTGRIYNPGPVVLKVTCPEFGVYLGIGNGLHPPNDTSCMAVSLAKSRTAGHTGMIAPKANPVITGFKDNGKQEIVGPSIHHPQIKPEVASWDFTNLDRQPIPIGPHGNFTIHMVISVDKQSNEALPPVAQIVAYNTNLPRQRVTRMLYVNEKRITMLKLPSTLLGSGDLIINLRSAVPGQWFKVKADSMIIMQPPSSFIWNLFKSELVILCEVVLLITIGVAASTALGWPVAMLTAMVAYILGNLFHFVHGLFYAGGFELFDYVQDSRMQHIWYYQVGSFITNVMVRILWVTVHLMPDFTRYDPLYFIVRSQDMPFTIVLLDGAWTLACILPILAIGYLLLRKQELA